MKYIFILLFDIFFITGLLAREASLTVEWNANKESDLACYRVHWGTASRKYSQNRLIDKQTKCTITGLEDGVRYYFAISALDYWGNESPYSVEASAYAGEIQPAPQIHLENNYPNPFNPGTVIKFELPEPQYIELAIFNCLGQKIKLLSSAMTEAGAHSVYWNGRDDAGQQAACGIYYYRLKSQNKIVQKSMLLLH